MSVSVLIASGKGGVGKSTFAANLGAALVFRGRGPKVVIIDADIGLRSQDTLLGLENSVVYDLIDVVNKDCDLCQALLDIPSVPGLSLLPASQFARIRDLESSRLKKIISALKEKYDYILIDAPAGIEKGLRTLLKAEPDQVVLISTADELCVRDAERVSQVIAEKNLPQPYLVVNRLDNELVRNGEMMSARVIASTLDIPLLGEIPEDPLVYRSVLRKVLFVDYDCPARMAVLRIAARLLGESVPFPQIGSTRIPLLRILFPKEMKEVTSLERH